MQKDVNSQYAKIKKRAETDENFRKQLAANNENKKASEKKLEEILSKEFDKYEKYGYDKYKEKYGSEPYGGIAMDKHANSKEEKAYTKSYKELSDFGEKFVKENMKSKIFTKPYLNYYDDGSDVNYGKKVAAAVMRRLEGEYSQGMISEATLSKPTFDSKMADHYQNKANKAADDFNKHQKSYKPGISSAIKSDTLARKTSEYNQIANLYRERDKKKRSK